MLASSVSHYDIIKKLGEGGMGEVYLAHDTRLFRNVALKLLPENLLKDEENHKRFIKEAQTASSLNHPNICIVHDINEYEGKKFIVMEYVDGQTLRNIMDKRGPLEEKEVIEIASKICDALSAVHSKGIMHRDIKPENIMISSSGHLKVMDFGLAKLAAEKAEVKESNSKQNLKLENKDIDPPIHANDLSFKSSSGLFGTVAYMSPDQVMGRQVDQRSDIYSLGVVIYELLTNDRPFQGETNETMLYKIFSEPYRPIEIDKSKISDQMINIIDRCLEKDPNKRYSTISRLQLDLLNIKHESELDTKKETINEIENKNYEQERRNVTVMVAEIFNYTSLIRENDPEEVSNLLDDFYNMFAAFVEKYFGRIEKIVEGTIQVVYGAPVASEYSQKEAVNTAIQIKNKLRELNQQQNINIDIKIGISSGTVLAGTIKADGKQNYIVFGEPINHAYVLKDNCEKNQTLVAASTYKLTKEEFEFKELSPIFIKDSKSKSDVYELISEKEKIHRPRLGSERQIYSVMVGRDNELQRLQFHLQNVIDGNGFIVNIIGEAGIGKSRLKAELKNLDEITKVIFLEGRSLSIGKNLSFHPLIDIMKNWAGITEDDSSQEWYRKLENLILDIYPQNAEEIFPFTATMMGIELSGKYAERVLGIKGDALEKLILKNLRELFAYSATQNPLVFVMEDLHWADATSIEFLESLYRLAENNRILFINIFRPNYTDTSEKVLGSIRTRYPEKNEELFIESLNELDGQRLINNLLKNQYSSSTVLNLISKKSGGNPFFIEEVVRSFIDEGAIILKNNNFIVTEKMDSIIIPETISEIIMARIDRLDRQTKSLLRRASVIGRNFFYKLIIEHSKDIENIDERLLYLENIQIIKKQKKFDEVEYLFKHAIAHETVYESILIKKRKELHIKTAEVIEKVFSAQLPKFYGILSYHYNNGENFEKAEDYLIKAGEEALKSSASSEAIEYFKDALNLYIKKSEDNIDVKKKTMLEYYIALALQNKGRFAESVKYFDSVQAYYGNLYPQEKFKSLFVSFLGYLHLYVAVTFPSLKWKKPHNADVKEKMNFWLDFNNTLGLIQPKRAFLGNLNFWREFTNYDLSEFEDLKINLLGTSGLHSFAGLESSISQKILDLMERKKDKFCIREKIWFNLFNQMHRWVSGHWQISSEDDYDKIFVQEFLKIGDITFASLYINQYTLVKIERGEFSAVQEMLAQLIEIGDIFENEYAKIIYYSSNSKLYMKWRKFNEAFEQIVLENQIGNKLGDKLIILQSFSFLARIQILSDKITEAEESLESARTYFSKDLAPWYKTDYFTSLLNLNIYYLEKTIKSKKREEVSKYSKKIVATGKAALRNSARFAGDRIEITRLMGSYYWLIEKPKKAFKWWEGSINFGKQSGGKLELSRTFMEVGKRLSEGKSTIKELNGVSAEEYLLKAKLMFEEMELEWDLKELEKLTEDKNN